MTTKHDHHNCEHQVRYCKVCDVAYCVKCGKEWEVPQPRYWYYPCYQPCPTVTSPQTTDSVTQYQSPDNSTSGGNYHVH